MKLYEVCDGTIYQHDVVRETTHRFTENNGGYIKKCEMSNNWIFGCSYYTTDWDIALQWKNRMLNKMKKILRNDIPYFSGKTRYSRWGNNVTRTYPHD